MTGKRVLLLRGINVGGAGKLAMADLRGILSDLGAADVATYIQSGNAVLRGDLSAAAISDAIEARAGFRPRAMVLSAEDFRAAVDANPFADAVSDHRSLHLYFLDGEPAHDPGALNAAKTDAERWHVVGRVFFLHSPGGLSQGKLADGLERRLGVAATGRNWNTVARLLRMLDE